MRGNLSNEIVSIKIEEGSKRPISLHEKSFFGKIEEDKKAAEPEDAEKQQISGAELKEAFTAIGEFMSVADYDSALQLIEKLSDYNVPEKEKERCDALRKAADEFMYEKISELLKEGE